MSTKIILDEAPITYDLEDEEDNEAINDEVLHMVAYENDRFTDWRHVESHMLTKWKKSPTYDGIWDAIRRRITKMKNAIDTKTAADEDMARTADADEDKAEAHEEPEANEGKLSTIKVAPEEDPESQMLLTSENVGKHVKNLQSKAESLGEGL